MYDRYNINYASENIAAGQNSAQQAFNEWMNSPSHKQSILTPEFTESAIAVYYNPNTEYKYYWVELFIGN